MNSNINQSPDLTIRKFLINLESGFPRHWHSGHAFESQLYNALSMSFPAGEQAFIDSVRDCLPLLPADAKYDALRQSAKDFIAQEATHRRIHERYNAVLAEQGLVNHWQDWIPKRLAKFKAKGVHPLNFLATTVAYEHMTAVLADVTFAHPELLEQATPDMQALWRWHSSEESEHRSLAFDLYTALGGKYRNRIACYLIAIFWFAVETAAQTTNNLWHDKTLFKPSTWWQFLVHEFHPTKGMLWLMGKPMLTFFSRDFHPWKNQSIAPARQWLSDNKERWQAVGA
jgi:predicted metal-dependent hydrolase